MDDNRDTTNVSQTIETRLFIAGKWVQGTSSGEVLNKFDGTVIADLSEAGRDQVTYAVTSAAAAFKRGAPPQAARADILIRAADLLKSRRDQMVRIIVAEAGFTASEATGEVTRGIQTLLASADEAKRLVGEMIPIGGAPGNDGRIGFTMRIPIGVVCAITPFNAPLNTVLHKVAPAFAAGNSVILKPASATPLTSALLVSILLDAGMPPDFISLLHGPGGKIGQWLCEEPDIKFYAFTGSTAVGKRIHSAVGLRRTQMELGSIAATILQPDADLDYALPKVLGAGFRKAGQVCTSIQRLYVHASIYDKVKASLTASVAALRAGNPNDPEVDTGPLISEAEAIRVEGWVREAAEQGADILAGGVRTGSVVTPTLIANTDPSMRVMAEEIFGPVMILRRFSDLDDAIDEINATPYGLASGIFTQNIEAGMHAAAKLQVGGVHINETSSSRVDVMPYGGCKDSGFGREGPRYAMHEMSEERLVTITVQGYKNG